MANKEPLTMAESVEAETKGKTKPKKELKIVKVVNTALFKFQYEGGGELPADLSGMYTSPKECDKALAAYERKKARASRSPS